MVLPVCRVLDSRVCLRATPVLWVAAISEFCICAWDPAWTDIQKWIDRCSGVGVVLTLRICSSARPQRSMLYGFSTKPSHGALLAGNVVINHDFWFQTEETVIGYVEQPVSTPVSICGPQERTQVGMLTEIGPSAPVFLFSSTWTRTQLPLFWLCCFPLP